MTDRLRPLWDFGDLDATERRLTQQLEAEDVERAARLRPLAGTTGDPAGD